MTISSRPLRFITCGSVDDGKSTLIGRLLYDSKALMIDQLDSLARHTNSARGARSFTGELDLSLITDGLEAEREQGITIDVAYRYFTTPKRKFIIADAPGHEQYTRNMVTGASKSDVAVILIDVTKVDFTQNEIILLPQTKRHAAIAGLLGIRHLIVAVNKMDAIAFDETKFNRVVDAFTQIAASLALPPFAAIPISALRGDGVVAHSENTSWFNGASLLASLEAIELHDSGTGQEQPHSLVAVQYVTRDAADDHRRWITGDVADAAIAVGDAIRVFPSGAQAVVAELSTPRGSVATAKIGEAVAIALDRQVDVARGDWIVGSKLETAIAASQQASAVIAWLDTTPLVVGRRLLARHGTRWLPARVSRVERRLNLQTAQWNLPSAGSESATVSCNEIVEATIEFASNIPLADYSASQTRGAIVLVDPGTHATAAAGMIRVEK